MVSPTLVGAIKRILSMEYKAINYFGSTLEYGPNLNGRAIPILSVSITWAILPPKGVLAAYVVSI
jgi:hypothetical protein